MGSGCGEADSYSITVFAELYEGMVDDIGEDNRINDFYSMGRLRERVCINIMLKGKAYIELLRSGELYRIERILF